MLIKFKKLSSTAITPSKNNELDAGIDLYSDEDVTLTWGVQSLISTNISLEIPEGYVGLIWPRSGLAAKHGICVLAGVIDCTYRGDIKVCLMYGGVNKVYDETEVHSFFSDKQAVEEYKIKKGDKIAQMLIQKVEASELIEVENLSSSSRDQKGFGSSGY